MNEQLKDCPFCGCAATFVKHSAGMPGTQGFDKWDAVACKHCRATVGACDRRFRNREDAADAWNRRIPLAAPTGSESGDALDAARWRAMRQQFAGVDFGDRNLAPLVALFKTEVTQIMFTPSGADKIADAALQSAQGGASHG